MSIIGIYKITSPSNNVYIGQSWNIDRRVKDYKCKSSKGQPALNNSFLKYGINEHLFEIIHEFNEENVTQDDLDYYEGFYMEIYRGLKFALLNIREAGSRGKHSTESILKMKQSNNSGRFKKGAFPKNKGVKGIQSAWNKGKTSSDSTKAKIKSARAKQVMIKGRTFSNEIRKKMSESSIKRGCNLPNGYRHSTETRLKISQSNKGMVAHNKGKKTSLETRLKQSERKLGKSGLLCPNSKQIICSVMGTVYGSIGIAAESLGIKRTTLGSYLSGQNLNKTTLIYKI